MTPFAARVKELRAAAGLTQIKLAEKAGTGLALISAIEAGRYRYVTPAQVAALAHGLGVPESELWATIPGGKSGRRWVSIAS